MAVAITVNLQVYCATALEIISKYYVLPVFLLSARRRVVRASRKHVHFFLLQINLNFAINMSILIFLIFKIAFTRQFLLV